MKLWTFFPENVLPEYTEKFAGNFRELRAPRPTGQMERDPPNSEERNRQRKQNVALSSDNHSDPVLFLTNCIRAPDSSSTQKWPQEKFYCFHRRSSGNATSQYTTSNSGTWETADAGRSFSEPLLPAKGTQSHAPLPRILIISKD